MVIGLSGVQFGQLLYIELSNSFLIGRKQEPFPDYPERETSMLSCNGVFTSEISFNNAFPAKITVFVHVRIEI